jgi:hypothetical protein
MKFKKGDKVAWKMFDGNIMAGEVVDVGMTIYSVKRVDGTVCTLDQEKARPATAEDVMKAIKFYQTLGDDKS